MMGEVHHGVAMRMSHASLSTPSTLLSRRRGIRILRFAAFDLMNDPIENLDEGIRPILAFQCRERMGYLPTESSGDSMGTHSLKPPTYKF